MLLNGRGLTQIRDAAICLKDIDDNTIHQAIGVIMHWVILGMELEYEALGTRQQS